MKQKPSLIAYDDTWWYYQTYSGSAHYVSNDSDPDPPKILIPDGRGGFKEHAVCEKPKRRLGF